jgi:hypothetical protein
MVNTLKLYLLQTSYLQGSIYIVPVFEPAHSALHLSAAWKSLGTQIMSTKSGVTHLVSLFEQGIGLEDAHLGILQSLESFMQSMLHSPFFPKKNECFS